jgi:hypothetical protein
LYLSRWKLGGNFRRPSLTQRKLIYVSSVQPNCWKLIFFHWFLIKQMKINLADESDMFACIVMSVACIKKMCLLARSQPFTKKNI